MADNLTCKECHMKFADKGRLERHFAKAHPVKRKFVSPDKYWFDPGAGI